ncbi:nicotinate phosphoribosyltransferase [Modicella reniformis]|uniref:Nicotinate phosphoribosyltransferase n=1 Tax=Modicella reniformis TaxID=1440133 RepID=A0A9P6IXM9_9FUNG|nr:nicotinate phosphoribosyltransferase [Modicella reniformis]
MQQAVRQHYPHTPCDYRFTNRTPKVTHLPLKGLPWLQQKIQAMAKLQLTMDERSFLEVQCPYLTKEYLDWLQNEFRFRPEEQVKIRYGSSSVPTEEPTITTTTSSPSSPSSSRSEPNQNQATEQLEIMIMGEWDQVILYEVPILSLVAEAYYLFGDQDWSYEGQFEAAKEKADRLIRAGAKFAEFGTRRRRDYETQRIVLQGLVAADRERQERQEREREETQIGSATAAKGGKSGLLTGTSNLHFAHIMNITPIGTMAHEWFMGTAAILQDAGQANPIALDRWTTAFPGQVLGIALTDTFTTEVFLKVFQGFLARDWVGVRHDSGDPFEFMDRIIQHYDQDPLVGPELRKGKRIVFSDGLDTDRAIQLQQAADTKEIQVSFGIGTHFTNDYRHAQDPEHRQSSVMNIVIKLHSCAGKECVKLSDDPSKESGSMEVVSEVKRQIGAK